MVTSKFDMIMEKLYYTMHDIVDPLVENDIDIVSCQAARDTALPASLMRVCHRDTLQECANHACLWLSRAEEPIHIDFHVPW
jgi:hypothetical protein